MNRYKECQPADTITRVRAVLNELGLTPIEHWFSATEDVCSVRLSVPELESFLKSGGKGRTVPLALASACGEFIERLQNYFLFPLYTYYEFDADLCSCGGFLYDPLERLLRPSELAEHIPPTHLDAFCLRGSGGALREIDAMPFIMSGQSIAAVPFYNVRSSGSSYVPAPLLYYLYGSNGMCAGNTPEEAIVQGTSEVLERYVNRKIVRDRITPPRVSRSDVEACFPEVFGLIETIESAGDCEIEVRDCSLGVDLPVMAVILLQRSTGKYFVKLGSHPDLRVALERALLELCQFRAPKSFPDLMTFDASLDHETYASRANLAGIFHNGAGRYPFELFSPRESYQTSRERYTRCFRDNGECLGMLAGIFERMGWEWLIRDVSFLGFPSYHVVVPGVSEINELRDREILQYARQWESRRLLRKLPESSDQELATLIDTIEEEMALGNTGGTLAGLSRLPLSSSSGHSRIDYRSLLIMAYHALGMTDRAYEHVLKGIHDEPPGGSRVGLMRYFHCLKSYRDLTRRGAEGDVRGSILSGLFPGAILDMVLRDLSDPRALLRRTPRLSCPDCLSCACASECRFDEIRGIVRRLKLRHAGHPIDQNELRRLFRAR